MGDPLGSHHVAFLLLKGNCDLEVNGSSLGNKAGLSLDPEYSGNLVHQAALFVLNRYPSKTTSLSRNFFNFQYPPHIHHTTLSSCSPKPHQICQLFRFFFINAIFISTTPFATTSLSPPPSPPPPRLSRLPRQIMATKFWFSTVTTSTDHLFHAPFRRKKTKFSPSFASLQGVSKVQFIDFGGRKLSVRRRLLVLPPKATTDQPGQLKEDEIEDSKILQYCSIDGKGKKSMGEMEQEFLQALQSFYYEGKAIMSNEEFDNLKEELMWEGSSVVMLSPDEQRFLEASMAYVSGNPIMTDKEYDKLKMKLKRDGSDIVVEGPRCSLRSRKVYSDLSVDYLKMFLLNVPAAVVALGLFFFLDDLTGFEITYLLELPEPFSFIFTWFAALPLILWLSFTITNIVVKDFLILKGPCPNCGTENTSFFGTILSVSNGGSSNKVKCSGCGTDMVYDSDTRLITLPEGSNA